MFTGTFNSLSVLLNGSTKFLNSNKFVSYFYKICCQWLLFFFKKKNFDPITVEISYYNK
jgi:hypothetical protein